MNFVTINEIHVNLDHVTAFCWDDGCLVMEFNGNNKNHLRFTDPYHTEYEKLCARLILLPITEG